MDLLERYKNTLKITTRGDQGITGVESPGTYLGNTPGPIPPKQSPIEAEYEEVRENQPLDGTSIDGGTTNDPTSGFIQRYNADNSYYTNNEGIVRANISTNDLIQSTKITALDIEDTSAGVEQGVTGGPNRTSAANGTKSTFMDGGNYKVLRYPTRAKFINTSLNSEDGGTLETMTLQQYTPNRTYLEVLADPSLAIEQVINDKETESIQGSIPTSIDESIVPNDVKPKLNDLKNFNI